MRRVLFAFLFSLLGAVPLLTAQTTEISATPSSLSFANTYMGKASGAQVITINNLTTSGQVIIQTISFSCPGFGISSGIAPFTLGVSQKITHYSIFFQPTLPLSYNCNFVLILID